MSGVLLSVHRLATRLFLGGALIILAAVVQARAAPETVGEILAALPPGSRAEQGAWLYAEARRHTDAQLAYRLMKEVVRRGEGTVVDEARLWQVRFWIAAGQPERASVELDLLETLPPGAPGSAQASYWRLVTGREAPVPEVGPLRLPPWPLLAQLAALRGPLGSRSAARFALALEGSVRRWGLLGPWLWRLQRSDAEALRRAAAEIARNTRGALAGAPERAALSGGGIRAQARGRSAPAGTAGEVAGDAGVLGEGLGEARRFAVEVGAFAERSVAGELVRELGSHGFPAYVAEAAPAGEATVLRVLLGPCERIADAESLGIALADRWMLPYRIVEAP